MRYLCVNCDEKFELSAEQEARCPKCLRVHGLRTLAAAAAEPPPQRRNRIRVGLAALVLAALGGGGYALFSQQRAQEASDPGRGPLTSAQLGRALAARGIAETGLEQALSANPSVERFAREATAGRSEAGARATAIAEALSARAKRDAFVRWSLSEPRDGALRRPAEVLDAISRDGARLQLYPLELAALALAALRAVEVPARLVELYAVSGERTPLDPSGRIGYFAVALGDDPVSARIFDVYGGRPEIHGCSECALLSDTEAVGALLSLRAVHRMAQNEAPAQALRDAESAAKLLPGSPTVRSSHGAVLLANGARDPGQNEFEAAAQLKPDPPRRNNLAMLHLALGDAERAAQEVARALERQPEYAAGHVTLAQIHLARGERDLARTELEKAESLDPRQPSLPLTWAQFHASAGEYDQAIEYARRAAQLRSHDPQVRLLLAQILHQASRYDEMRAEARAALALAPAAIAPKLRELIGRMLGPTALEDSAPSAAPAAPDAPVGTGAQPGDPSLQGAPKAPRLRLSDADPTLKLRGPSP